MALPHAAPAQPIDVAPLGAALSGTPSSALFKSEGLEVMRVVLPPSLERQQYERRRGAMVRMLVEPIGKGDQCRLDRLDPLDQRVAQIEAGVVPLPVERLGVGRAFARRRIRHRR